MGRKPKPSAIDKFGRLLIPKELRNEVGLTVGGEVRIVADKGELRLSPRKPPAGTKEVAGMLVFTGKRVGDLDVGRTLKRERARRDRRLARRKK